MQVIRIHKDSKSIVRNRMKNMSYACHRFSHYLFCRLVLFLWFSVVFMILVISLIMFLAFIPLQKDNRDIIVGMIGMITGLLVAPPRGLVALSST